MKVLKKKLNLKENIYDLYNLKRLSLHKDRLKEIPKEIGNLQNLQRLYPAFQYRLTKHIDECTIGQNGPLPRSPMSIKRIHKDFSFQAEYLGLKAFDDFILHQELLRAIH